jgi:acetoin utilization deacetylase AcuC-like enzyme
MHGRSNPNGCMVAGMSIPFFFSERMVAARHSSYSPSAGKPAQVVASWRKLAQAERLPLEWHDPAPATPEELERAHDAGFVEDVLACRRKNGFGDTSPEVATSLPYTTGAMLSAARHVLRTQGLVAVAPCSGFHHARWSSAEGFCTFNGLMVTALCVRDDARRNGGDVRVGILDCDMHYGDGTDAILAVLTDASFVEHWTAGAHFTEREQAATFLAELPGIVRRMRACDVVLYQAGADPHVDDPLGGWLTTEELRRRDAIVFDELARMGIPVVWNLAGGYQRELDGSIPKVLEIHDNTLRECARVYTSSS